MSSASAATPYVKPAFHAAVAYRGPMARMPIARAFRAPVRTAWRPAYRPAVAAAPAARYAYNYRRAAQPAYGRFGYGYRLARQMARPAAYGRLATRVAPRVVRIAPARPTVTLSSPALALGVPAAVPATPVGARVTAPSVRRVAVAPVPARPRVATAALPAPAGGGKVGGQVGGASYYSGGRTASGGFVGAATCAHRSLPFGTRVLVTNLANARTTVCVVNDRGPFVGGRVVDLSRGAAGAIGMLGAGVAPVRLQVMGRS